MTGQKFLSAGFSPYLEPTAVLGVVDRGYSVQEVADRLGIKAKSLYGWKAKFV